MLTGCPEQTCATCIWWERQGPRLANAVRDPSASPATGTCQVRAPVVVQGGGFPVTLFPVTHESRFCGEWEGLDEGGDGDGGERVITFPVERRVAA